MSYLEKHSISPECLLYKSSIPVIDENDFVNGLVLDLYSFAAVRDLPNNDYFFNWIPALLNRPKSSINLKAVVSKVHFVIKKVRTKRGANKEAYLNEKFEIPFLSEAKTFEPQPGTSAEASTGMEQVSTLTAKLEERREAVKSVREKSKQTKRKLERMEIKLKEKAEKVFALETENKKLKQENKQSKRVCESLKVNQAKSSLSMGKLKENISEQKRIIQDLKIETKVKDVKTISLEKIIQENSDLVDRAKETEKKLRDADIAIDYLQDLLNDQPEIELYDKTAQKYKTETVQCVMNLTDLKVPVEKVGEVIKEVASLCGKNVDCLPSASTVNRIVDSKVSLAQKQIGSVLKGKEHTALYTDETRKYGKSFQTYVVTDQEQNSYIIGLREMVDKSGRSTLETLKDILIDISEYCHQKENEKDLNIGYKILSNIRDTMSDRASTEKNFNTLLEQFRAEILPDVVDNWPLLTENERRMCTNMNNFFCGLHLLVGMADTCETTLKKFEKNYLDGKDIGSGTVPELKRYHKSESGPLRLVRTSSKAFAVGQDEKNGVSLQWQTFLGGKDEKNYITRFKHNRFNLLFSLALAVYYHSKHISEFLDEVQGTTNMLLKAVSLDIKEPLLLAGLKALGLISKLVTGPLWKILEAPGHIFEMNVHYKSLIDFLDKGASDVAVIGKFVTGEISPFNTVIGEDKLSSALLQDTEELNGIVFPLLQGLFLSMSQLLKRMVADHLPGGKFAEPSEVLYEQTRSVMKHNKLPEFVFGQLDQLLRYRPNATLLTNESYLMYSHNKTRQWLDALPEEERKKLIEESRSEGQRVRQTFKDRLKEIEAKRIEIQEEKKRQLQEKERKRIQNLETMTNGVCYYGLWQNLEQVNEGLSRLPTEKEKKEGLKAQLRFRQSVLNQKFADRKVFNFTKKSGTSRQPLSVEEMKANVLQLIHACLDAPTTEKESQDVPLLVGKRVEHTFANREKYTGMVISVVPGFNQWYNIKYDNDEAIYAYNLAEDYKRGDLCILVESLN